MKSKTKLHFHILFSLVLFFGTRAFAAACCGGGFAAPALIVGDDRAQVSSSYSYSQVADDVGTDSLWRRRDSRESSEAFKLDAAHIFQDRWQAGLSVPVIRRTRANESSSGFGDISGTLGYEFLPEWDYSLWRPKGLGYLQLTAPTGRSINESETTYQLEARGRGFWALGAGAIFTKIIRHWDFFSSLDAHRSFSKEYRNSQSQGTLNPGSGGNLSLGAGYNLGSLRAGGSLTWTYEEGVDVSGTSSSRGALQRYTTATASASYLMKDEWAATATYSDQTLFGAPTNTSLSRGLSVLLQKRWLR